MLGGVLGAAGFVLAVLGLVRGPHLSSNTRSCSPAMLGVGIAHYVSGQMLERLLKDTPDDGWIGGLARFLGRCSRTCQRKRSATPGVGRVIGGLGLRDVAPGPVQIRTSMATSSAGASVTLMASPRAIPETMIARTMSPASTTAAGMM